jgi:hypothetical protein
MAGIDSCDTRTVGHPHIDYFMTPTHAETMRTAPIRRHSPYNEQQNHQYKIDHKAR